MHKKSGETFDCLGWKSFFLAIFLFSVGLLLFFYFDDIRDRIRTADKENFKGQTKGVLVSIEPIERIKHGKYKGTRIYVNSYKISYRYVFDGQTFSDSDIIPFTALNKKFLDKLLDDKTTDTLL